MTPNNCPCENTLSLLGLKKKPSKKEVKEIWKKLQKYHPDRCPKTIDEEFNNECKKKYNDLTALINRAREEFYDAPVNQSEINSCISCYEKQLKNKSQEEIKYSLSENKLDTNGNRNTLQTRLLNNVPYLVFKLNIWQYNAQKNLTEKYLKQINENKLSHILFIKNIPGEGNKNNLIKIIRENIDELELFEIVQNVEKDFKNFKTQLKKLSKEQLIIILERNNLSSNGKEPILIERILDSLNAPDIKNSIKEASSRKEDALKKLEKLIGRSKFSQNYLDMLEFWGLNKSHGVQIKEKITKSIYDYEISENEVEERLNNLLKATSEEYEKELLNELFSITGKDKHSETYLQQLNVLQLSEMEGMEVKNQMINLIKTHSIQKNEIKDKLHELLEETYRKFEEEKLKILYDFAGNESHTPEFNDLLDKNELSHSDGFEIKKEMEELIKIKVLSNNEIIPEFKKFIVFKGYDIHLTALNIYELNQIAIINNIDLSKKVEKQKELIVNSEDIDINTIKSNINDITRIKNELKTISKKHLKFILNKFNLSTNGIKKDLIYRLLSNIHYEKINNEINNINDIIDKLYELTKPQLEDILSKHGIIFNGDKTQIINEITKKVEISDIKKDLDSLINLNSQLQNVDMASINYIADIHGIDKSKERDIIIKEILNTVDLIDLRVELIQANSIEKTLETFNQKQIQYITQTYNTNTDEILDKVGLKEIDNIINVIKRITKKLNSYNTNQLNYILYKNNLPQTTDKEDQIDIILQHVLIPDIQKNIRTIKQINNKINRLSENSIKEIFEKNGLEYKENEDNKSKIKESIPINKIEKYLSD